VKPAARGNLANALSAGVKEGLIDPALDEIGVWGVPVTVAKARLK